MRLLHVLPSLKESYGGPLRLVIDLSARARAEGVQSEIAGVNKLEVRSNPLPASVFHCFSGGNEAGYAYSQALWAWLLAHVRKYDAVAIHGAWHFPGWSAHVACLKHQIPYAYFPHGMLERWAVKGQGVMKRAKKKLYWRFREGHIANSATKLFFTTHKEEELTRSTFAITAPSDILSVYGIDDVTPAEMVSELEGQFSADARIALFLSRLHPKKNLPFLLQCWRDAKVPAPWILVIAGSGEPGYETHVRELARDYGLGGQVRFMGFVSGQEKSWLLHRAEWFLLPSSQENFGIAVLEAVAHNCAVAITDRVYLSESFRPGSVVLPLEADAWVKFLRGQFQDLEFRNQTAAADHAHLLKSFRMDLIVQRWASAFRNLCGAPVVV